MSKPRVLVCRGSDCRKRKKARKRLLDLLDGRARVVPVGCQKICDGPVVGLVLDGELQWFEEVDGGKVRDALDTWLTDGTVGKPLAKRRIKKRAGKLR